MTEFYLQDSRGTTGSRLMWWTNGGGYTSDLSKAEVFTRDRALRQHKCRETDVPWLMSYIDSKGRAAVDHQIVCNEEALAGASLSDDTPCYVQTTRCWDGNDLYWLTADGNRSLTDLALAGVFTYAQACRLAAGENRQVWPKAYIDAKRRMVASTNDVSLKEAAKLAWLTLTKPVKPRRDVHRCHSCRKFISVQDFYGDCCHCGANNRP
jgi:hypothetical protein